MREPPIELNLPKTCPKCGEAWVGFGTSADKVSLFCDQNHLHNRDSTDAEILAFERALYPDKDMAKEVWLVGGTAPWPGMAPLPPHAAVPGFRLTINDEPFIVVRVDNGRVWIDHVVTDPN